MIGMQGKRIVVGVTGGIAAYKTAALVSRLTALGAEVDVILTEAATHFVGELTFRTLSGRRVITSFFDRAMLATHVAVGRDVDLVIVAPATANVLGKAANGIADDALTTVLLATRAPILLAPSMNNHMFEHPAVQENLVKLKGRGCVVLEPEIGRLADGSEGRGRMVEPDKIVAEAQRILFGRWDLAGVRVLVTAGGTREPIDAVRFIANPSTGKMGYAVAKAALWRGARVTLVSGPTQMDPPHGLDLYNVETALGMRDAVLEAFETTDVVIMAAAVADYRAKDPMRGKIKKGNGLTLELEQTPDILEGLGKKKGRKILIGFAAETGDLAENAKKKLREKNLDLIVANDVSQEGAGFGSDTNIVTLIDAAGTAENLPKMSKEDIAARVLDWVAGKLKKKP